MPPYALAVLSVAGQPTPTIVVAGRHFSLLALAPGLVGNPATGLLDILRHWETVEPALDDFAWKLADGSNVIDPLPMPLPADYLKLVDYPTKLIFCGLNYWDHLRDDLGITEFEKSDYDPLLFLKHAGALAAAGATIDFPRQTTQLDWEVELVAIFGKPGRFIASDDWQPHVAGYAVGLDLSARDWQNSKRHFKEFDLFGGKAFDDASPVGPLFVPARLVDPPNLGLQLWVNEERKQNSSTRHMIWSIGELIEFATKHMAVDPGDMLFTGSPAGVGLVKNTYLKPGDEVRAEISGLGELRIHLH